MYLLTARSRHEPETPEEVWVEVRTTVIGWRCANIIRLFFGYVAVPLRVFFSEGLVFFLLALLLSGSSGVTNFHAIC